MKDAVCQQIVDFSRIFQLLVGLGRSRQREKLKEELRRLERTMPASGRKQGSRSNRL